MAAAPKPPAPEPCLVYMERGCSLGIGHFPSDSYDTSNTHSFTPHILQKAEVDHNQLLFSLITSACELV